MNQQFRAHVGGRPRPNRNIEAEKAQIVHSPQRSAMKPISGISAAVPSAVAWLSIESIVARKGLFATSFKALT